MQSEHALTLLETIDNCFRSLHGSPLPCPENTVNRLQWLDEEAPFSILAHKNGAPPRFIYANDYALTCFKYSLEEMLGLPSNQSAAKQDRAEREKFLQEVAQNGIVYDYSGPRIDKYGTMFFIYAGIVWQLFNQDGTPWGQAALFWTDQKKRPKWYNISKS